MAVAAVGGRERRFIASARRLSGILGPKRWRNLVEKLEDGAPTRVERFRILAEEGLEPFEILRGGGCKGRRGSAHGEGSSKGKGMVVELGRCR